MSGPSKMTPGDDAAARVALLAYAIATHDARLAAELQQWVTDIEEANHPGEAAQMRLMAEQSVARAVTRTERAKREVEGAAQELARTREVLDIVIKRTETA